MNVEESKKLISAAVTTILAAGLFSTAASAADGASKEMSKQETCYGIAMAGKNDCATGKHSCSGMATTDKSPDDYKLVPAAACEKSGGKLKPPAGS